MAQIQLTDEEICRLRYALQTTRDFYHMSGHDRELEEKLKQARRQGEETQQEKNKEMNP